MRYSIVLLLAWLSMGFASAQDAPLQYAETASVRALNFTQGDRASLQDARSDFSSAGWSQFLKSLDGFVDDRGVPKFSSSFTPSGKALQAGPLRFIIPGVLEQKSRTQAGGVSSTAYRAEVEVQLGGQPLKVEQLVQKTCGGANTVSACR